jgi:hypothetical protein
MRHLLDIVESAQSVRETLEPSTVPTLTKHKDHNQPGYSFKIDGREYYVGFRGSDGDYYMSFTGEDDRGRHSAKLLGHGKPFRVFSGVLTAILTFIKQHKPDQIEFDVDDAEQERVRTYDLMLDAAEKRGLMPKGYVWDRDGNNNYYIFVKGYR